jgi:hypothetical protein
VLYPCRKGIMRVLLGYRDISRWRGLTCGEVVERRMLAGKSTLETCRVALIFQLNSKLCIYKLSLHKARQSYTSGKEILRNR